MAIFKSKQEIKKETLMQLTELIKLARTIKTGIEFNYPKYQTNDVPVKAVGNYARLARIQLLKYRGFR